MNKNLIKKIKELDYVKIKYNESMNNIHNLESKVLYNLIFIFKYN